MSQLASTLTDLPISADSDHLDSARYARGLARFIQQTGTPITIGIQGGWGSGKTSLINILGQLLGSPGAAGRSAVCVSINAWEHSLFRSNDRAAVAYSLLDGIVDAILAAIKAHGLAADGSAQEAASVKGSLKRLALGSAAFAADVVTAGRLSSASQFTGAALNYLDGPKGAAVAEPPLETSIAREVARLRSRLDGVIDEALKRSNGLYDRFAVFVDDLDRVHPETAVDILDVMKNILSIPRCVFVLAIDFDVVVKGLSAKFGQRGADNEREFRQYFDKIIQVPFSMPVGSYSRHFPAYLARAIRQFTPLDLSEATCKQLGDAAAHLTDGSPRSVKRIVNTLALLQLIANEEGEADEVGEAGLARAEAGRGTDSGDEAMAITEARADDAAQAEAELLVRFIAVGLQVSHPDVFSALVKTPDFYKWTPRHGGADIDGAQSETAGSRVPAASGAKPPEPWRIRLKEICGLQPWTRARSDAVNQAFDILLSGLRKLDRDKPEAGQVPGLDTLTEILDATTVTSVTESAPAEPVSGGVGYRGDVVTRTCRSFVRHLMRSGQGRFKVDGFDPDRSYAGRADTGRGHRRFEWDFVDSGQIGAGSLHLKRQRNRSVFDVEAGFEVLARHGTKTGLHRHLQQSPPPGTDYPYRNQLRAHLGTLDLAGAGVEENARRLAERYSELCGQISAYLDGAVERGLGREEDESRSVDGWPAVGRRR